MHNGAMQICPFTIGRFSSDAHSEHTWQCNQWATCFTCKLAAMQQLRKFHICSSALEVPQRCTFLVTRGSQTLLAGDAQQSSKSDCRRPTALPSPAEHVNTPIREGPKTAEENKGIQSRCLAAKMHGAWKGLLYV